MGEMIEYRTRTHIYTHVLICNHTHMPSCSSFIFMEKETFRSVVLPFIYVYLTCTHTYTRTNTCTLTHSLTASSKIINIVPYWLTALIIHGIAFFEGV